MNRSRTQTIGPRTVLVADDDDDTRALLRAVLERAGWRVIEARDGQRAFEAMIDESPDVALIDHGMPFRSGAEVVRALRAGSLTTPVVLMTGAPGGSEIARSLGLGPLVTKPLDARGVTEALERAIARRGSALRAAPSC